MNPAVIRAFFSLCIILIFQPGNCQSTDEKWGVKIDLLGSFNNNFSFEVDRQLKDNLWIVGRLGITNPDLFSEERLAEGFFLKGGVRYYFYRSENPHTGPFVQPTLIYNYWKNPFRITGRVSDVNEVSIGGVVEAGYSIPLLDFVRIEPVVGLGFVPTWTNYTVIDDTPPFEQTRIKWSLSYYDEVEQPPVSHLPLKSAKHLAVSFGLNVGIIFG